MSKGVPGSTGGHGTYARYKHGCHCDPCRAAQRRRQKETRLKALRGQPIWVPRIGTTRRVRALARIGWASTAVGERLGISGSAITDVTTARNPMMLAETAMRIRAVYEDLCMTIGPSSGARRFATRKGWPPPLAWDDGTIDDPDATPFIGTSSEYVHADDLEDLIRWGGTYKSIEARLGIGHDGIYHRVRNRPELLAMLHRNADGLGIGGAA